MHNFNNLKFRLEQMDIAHEKMEQNLTIFKQYFLKHENNIKSLLEFLTYRLNMAKQKYDIADKNNKLTIQEKHIELAYQNAKMEAFESIKSLVNHYLELEGCE